MLERITIRTSDEFSEFLNHETNVRREFVLTNTKVIIITTSLQVRELFHNNNIFRRGFSPERINRSSGDTISNGLCFAAVHTGIPS